MGFFRFFLRGACFAARGATVDADAPLASGREVKERERVFERDSCGAGLEGVFLTFSLGGMDGFGGVEDAHEGAFERFAMKFAEKAAAKSGSRAERPRGVVTVRMHEAGATGHGSSAE